MNIKDRKFVAETVKAIAKFQRGSASNSGDDVGGHIVYVSPDKVKVATGRKSISAVMLHKLVEAFQAEGLMAGLTEWSLTIIITVIPSVDPRKGIALNSLDEVLEKNSTGTNLTETSPPTTSNKDNIPEVGRSLSDIMLLCDRVSIGDKVYIAGYEFKKTFDTDIGILMCSGEHCVYSSDVLNLINGEYGDIQELKLKSEV